jgi:hypothetical protein
MSLLTPSQTAAAAALTAVLAGSAFGIDTYSPLSHQLSIPLMQVGGASFRDVILIVGHVVSGPTGTSPGGNADRYDPASGTLTVPSVSVAGATYDNVVTTVASLVSIGSVSGADAYDGSALTMPQLQAGSQVYSAVVLSVASSCIAGVAGGMPVAAQDQYDPALQSLLIPAVTTPNGAVYTNVTVSASARNIVSIGGQAAAGGTIAGCTRLGLTWPVTTHEAEAGTLTGTAKVVGAPDGSDRAVGDPGGEASGRQAVLLTQPGDAVSWTTQPGEDGANALVVRFSMADAAGGGGQGGALALAITDPSAKPLYSQSLRLTSRYSWLYGGVKDGTKLYNSPANAAEYATASTATHLYDEIQLKLPVAVPAGSVVTLSRPDGSGAAATAIDFIDLETVPPPLAQPSGFVSLTDARCGAIATDLRGSGAVFDGADDSSYGSVFNAATGTNPYNPTGFLTHEKDYYSTDPATDALQDTVPNPQTAGLSMFALADHNLASLQACVNLVATSKGMLGGVYIPAGRFYVRGRLLLPGNITLQGAGMWYSKFTAVDTAPPMNVQVNGVSGIAAASGNFSIGAVPGGANNVVLANFALFGNVTQRDGIDSVVPDGVHAVLTDSIIDNLWVEHVFSGLKLLGASSGDSISHSRVRNTFADGIDFYGSTSNSRISNSSSRSTGDDGIALWSQGATFATTSQNDTVTNSFSNLQWYGNGFAIYGGQGMTVTQSRGADILNYPCLQISTYFVSALLPASVLATASADHLELQRCGGNGFDQQYGALLLVTDHESLGSVTLSDIHISEAAYKAIDLREEPLPATPGVVATMQATLTDIGITGTAACAAVGADTGGSLALDNVCTCATAGAVPQACQVNSTLPYSLSLTPATCSRAACP